MGKPRVGQPPAWEAADRDDSGIAARAVTRDPRAWAFATRNGRASREGGSALVAKELAMARTSAPCRPARRVPLAEGSAYSSLSVKTLHRYGAAGRITLYRVGEKLLQVDLTSS